MLNPSLEGRVLSPFPEVLSPHPGETMLVGSGENVF